MPADEVITRDGPVAVPMDYKVPTGTEIVPRSISASFDGSGAAGAFVPVLEVISPAGYVTAYCARRVDIAAGASVLVSWFPGIAEADDTTSTPSSSGGVETISSPSASIAVGTPSGPSTTVDVAGSGVAAGTYGDNSHVGQFTVGADGRITNAGNIAVSGGGFLSQSYVGYNTIGGSTEGNAGSTIKWIAKQVTLASAALMNTIDIYIKGNATNVGTLCCFVVDDNAGVPGKTVAWGQIPGERQGVEPQINVVLNTTPRWLAMPVAAWLAAGTYWLVVAVGNPAVAANVLVYNYDAGADLAGNNNTTWINDTPAALANSGRKYSIRASTIS